jgi:hypothetical protein
VQAFCSLIHDSIFGSGVAASALGEDFDLIRFLGEAINRRFLDNGINIFFYYIYNSRMMRRKLPLISASGWPVLGRFQVNAGGPWSFLQDPVMQDL